MTTEEVPDAIGQLGKTVPESIPFDLAAAADNAAASNASAATAATDATTSAAATSDNGDQGIRYDPSTSTTGQASSTAL